MSLKVSFKSLNDVPDANVEKYDCPADAVAVCHCGYNILPFDNRLHSNGKMACSEFVNFTTTANLSFSKVTGVSKVIA